MTTRIDLVLSAAKAMYHGIGPSEITEDEAWRDADEVTRGVYIRLALAAYKRISERSGVLLPYQRGTCVCRAELCLPPDVWNGVVQVTVICRRCEGGYRG